MPNLVFIALDKMSAGSVQDPSRETFATTLITRCALPPKWTTSPTVRPVLVAYPHPHSVVPKAAEHIVIGGPFVFISVVVSRSSELPSGSLSAPVADPTLLVGESVIFRSTNGFSDTTFAYSQSHASRVDNLIADLKRSVSGSCVDFSGFRMSQTFGVGFRPSLTGLRTRTLPVPLITPMVGAIFVSVVFGLWVLGSGDAPWLPLIDLRDPLGGVGPWGGGEGVGLYAFF